jgi:hypothetical protein
MGFLRGGPGLDAGEHRFDEIRADEMLAPPAAR